MAGLLPWVNGEAVIARLLEGHAMLPGDPDVVGQARGNPGLVFDRFLKVWEPDGPDRSLLRRDRQRALREFCDAYRRLAARGGSLLDELHGRLETLDTGEAAPVGRWACQRATFKTRWRVVTGVGAEHPIENGFTFDRSIGVPYFPGSSVKGLCRAAGRHLHDAGSAELDRLFGGQPEETHDPADARAGDLTFLPAYPARGHWPGLEVDIVNNHHPSYALALDRGAVNPQAVETDSPIPVFFLTVAAGTPFTFRIASRSGAKENVTRGLELLSSGLDLLGLGAKTAAGYGTFHPTPR